MWIIWNENQSGETKGDEDKQKGRKQDNNQQDEVKLEQVKQFRYLSGKHGNRRLQKPQRDKNTHNTRRNELLREKLKLSLKKTADKDHNMK